MQVTGQFPFAYALTHLSLSLSLSLRRSIAVLQPAGRQASIAKWGEEEKELGLPRLPRISATQKRRRVD